MSFKGAVYITPPDFKKSSNEASPLKKAEIKVSSAPFEEVDFSKVGFLCKVLMTLY